MKSWSTAFLVSAGLLVAGCRDEVRPTRPPPQLGASAAASSAEGGVAEAKSEAPPFAEVLGTGTGGSGAPPGAVSPAVEEPNESHATDLTVHEKPRTP